MPRPYNRTAVIEQHGLSKTPTYNSWRAAKERCTNTKHAAANNYSNRGIVMCDRWLRSFENFLADMGERPVGMSLERKDNSKGYEPGNCCWATRKTQSRNKRNNRIIELDGVQRTLADWAELTGINYATIITRIDREGWTVRDALSVPAGSRYRQQRLITFRGETMNLTAWAKRLGTNRVTLSERLAANSDVEQVFTSSFELPGITFNGETLSMAAWSRRLGGNDTLVQCRLRKGWDVLRAVSTPCKRKLASSSV